ncbi:MAG: TetR/AcrR family transcriptional regulator [Henriciella sp.]|nr:TetR/AcrR family transcriptional regulator [Henriciella sp.]
MKTAFETVKPRVEAPAAPARKGQKTRRLILDTALDCLNREGISKVNCRVVAKAAGLTPGNIYYYFENIDAIIAELGAGLTEAAEISLIRLADGQLSSREGRRQAALEWLEIVWTWRYAFLDFGQLQKDDPQAKANVRDMQERSVSIQAKALEEHMVKRGLELTDEDRLFCRDLAVSNWIISIHWLQYIALTRDIGSMSKEDFLGTVDRFSAVARTLYDDGLLRRLAPR